MKSIKILLYKLLVFVLFFQGVISMAQSPQKVSYQSIIRDATGELVRSGTVGIRISILQGSVGGDANYVETHAPVTNINGLASFEVGMGTPITGLFSEIDWSDGPYFLKVETDPSGGSSYTITGVSKILSVPYALHSKTAESVAPTSFQPPTATILTATNIQSSSATLNGEVNANGFKATSSFEWGLTTSYGNTTTTSSIVGTEDESLSIGISGLLPATTYHF